VKTRLLENRDVLSGLLFIAVGTAGFYLALAYPYGTLQQMGPGFFPRVLGVILVILGIVTVLRGLRAGARVEGGWGWYPLAMLTAALVAFGWLMERVGLIPSLVVLVIASAYAGKEFRLGEVLLLSVVMCVLAVAIFIWGLGLPYPLFDFEFGP
jgi:putative tricarboxylic transport membrane protein